MPAIQILSITPTQTSDALVGNTYDSYLIEMTVNGETVMFTHHTDQVFTYEKEEVECALSGVDLITSFLDRLRLRAAI